MKIKEKYNLAKQAKVGDKCICPSCNTEFVKTNYQQAFCKSKRGTICKDKYWNTVTPNKRNNKTRISPASKRWMASEDRNLKLFDRTSPSIVGGSGRISGITSEGYTIMDGVAYDEFDNPVYNVDPYEDDYDHGQW